VLAFRARVRLERVEDLRERDLPVRLCILRAAREYMRIRGSKAPTMWLPEYASFSPVSMNQRLRQCRRFDPHFIRYPLSTSLRGSQSAAGTRGVGGAGANATPADPPPEIPVEPPAPERPEMPLDPPEIPLPPMPERDVERARPAGCTDAMDTASSESDVVTP
jgi:hypothetical protein